MDIRKRQEIPQQPSRPKLPEGGLPHEHPGIMPGGCFPPRPPIRIDRDRAEFRKRDEDKNGVLTSDEYGVGKEKQDEFRRYDRNDDGKVDLKEFKLGRFLDAFRRAKPSFPDDVLKPVPLPLPLGPGGIFKPVPLPSADGEPVKPVPVHRPTDGTLGGVLAKVKQAQAQDE